MFSTYNGSILQHGKTGPIQKEEAKTPVSAAESPPPLPNPRRKPQHILQKKCLQREVLGEQTSFQVWDFME